MLPITFAAPVPSPIGTPVTFGWHTIEAAKDGQLLHAIDGIHVATVPPEGMRDYVRDWPQAADIVAQLLRPTPANDRSVDAEATAPGPAQPL